MALALIFFFIAAYCTFIFFMQKQNKRPSDIPWGEGKDLSSLLPSKEISELEQWWNTTQSDKARIKELQGANALLHSKVYRLESTIYKMQHSPNWYQNVEDQNFKTLFEKQIGRLPPERNRKTTVTFRGDEIESWEHNIEEKDPWDWTSYLLD